MKSKNVFTILLYHGVTDVTSKGIENCSGKHINKDVFLSQMRYVKKCMNVLSIDEMIHIYKNKLKIPKNSIIITFDDGFRNNYEIAAPILDDLDVPTIFYITSGVINNQDMFWVDEIEDIINNTLVKFLQLELDIFPYKKFNLTCKDLKINACKCIKTVCKQYDSNFRISILREMIEKLKIRPSSNNSENYKVMDWWQVEQLNNNSLFTIGGHSLYHDSLSRHDLDILQYDIHQTILLLKKYVKLNEVKHFSYPEGTKDDYNKYVIKVLQGNDIICCPTAIYGYNDINTNLFELKRIMVGLQGIKFPYKID